jgi:transposase
MTKKDLNSWIMYHEIQNLRRLGFSCAKIARHLVMDARTVGKYQSMSDEEYERFLLKSAHRKRILSAYEIFIKNKLTEYPDTSAAQIHDWLKESYQDFPEVPPRTVYNFVMFVRQKHNIPFVPLTREYFPIQELPYGEQAQVDFGEYNMRLANGQRKKVKFFAMVLSRSRMKFVWFLNRPFKATDVAQAHENAFRFFGGIPRTIVYDQDRTMVVDENLGNIILTATFKQYTKSRSFKLHFCRKADPESKGKVENVVQYVKKNFLYNRPYSDLKSLNEQCIGWLDRTANHLSHNYTKKVPKSEFIIEKPYLNHYIPMTVENKELKTYSLRKDNTINYRSNFYTLPMGTYTKAGVQVIVKENNGSIDIFSMNNELICTHKRSLLTGRIIANTNHKRDKSKSLNEMMEKASSYFSMQALAMSYFLEFKKKLPRYTRDNLQVILESLISIDKQTADKTLDFCLENKIYNGHQWKEVMQVFILELPTPIPEYELKPLNKINFEKANQTPHSSNIEDYEAIINS